SGGRANSPGDFIGTWQRFANRWIILSKRFYASANALPNPWRTLHQFLALSGQRRSRKEDDCSGDSNKRKHQEDYTCEARNVMLLQQDDDWVKNHGEEKNDREEQDHRLNVIVVKGHRLRCLLCVLRTRRYLARVSFNHFGLSPEVVRGTQAMGFIEPTPIQLRAFPIILAGKDLIGTAQTGTGKTAAF